MGSGDISPKKEGIMISHQITIGRVAKKSTMPAAMIAIEVFLRAGYRPAPKAISESQNANWRVLKIYSGKNKTSGLRPLIIQSPSR